MKKKVLEGPGAIKKSLSEEELGSGSRRRKVNKKKNKSCQKREKWGFEISKVLNGRVFDPKILELLEMIGLVRVSETSGLVSPLWETNSFFVW